MAVTEAPALVQARNDANARWPGRNKASDGIIGDPRHMGIKSDHNEGNAIDITHDPASGATGDEIANHALNDSRVKNVIWNRQIDEKDGKGWRPFTGDNPHTNHCHISIHAAARDDTRNWGWFQGGVTPPPPPPVKPEPPGPSRMPTRNMKRGSKGADVLQLQSVLLVLGHMTQAQLKTGPGNFGPQTGRSLKAFQAGQGVSADGIYGPQTRAAFKKIGIL